MSVPAHVNENRRAIRFSQRLAVDHLIQKPIHWQQRHVANTHIMWRWIYTFVSRRK